MAQSGSPYDMSGMVDSYMGWARDFIESAETLDLAVSGDEPTDIQAESLGEGGSDLVTIQLLALDLARLDHVLGQRPEGV